MIVKNWSIEEITEQCEKENKKIIVFCASLWARSLLARKSISKHIEFIIDNNKEIQKTILQNNIMIESPDILNELEREKYFVIVATENKIFESQIVEQLENKSYAIYPVLDRRLTEEEFFEKRVVENGIRFDDLTFVETKNRGGKQNGTKLIINQEENFMKIKIMWLYRQLFIYYQTNVHYSVKTVVC